ncbi:hypothetical protein SEPCBS119000_003531 [Sporothrix epigloea]|uniref:Glutamine amidotransferase type-2 domain-containing protein n=1 Tax=Sporothrix epigloea TaxID=1892477 RepID=A0ABP0DQS9_9PEZI
MCGIHVIIELFKPSEIRSERNGFQKLPQVLRSRLSRRGPDSVDQVEVTTCPREDGLKARLQFTSTVLALRGNELKRQPFVEAGADSVPWMAQRVLCWNGEVWRFEGAATTTGGNDGQMLYERLTTTKDPFSVLRAVEGPFAFVYYDGPGGQLIYGRDRLGRRSLLQQTTAEGRLTLSSVSDFDAKETPSSLWTEVEADGFYVVDLLSKGQKTSWTIVRHNWTDAFVGTSDYVVSGLGRFNGVSGLAGCYPLTAESRSVLQLGEQLAASMRLRVLHVPQPPMVTAIDGNCCAKTAVRIAILFSGGLDCTVIARIAHDLLPIDQAIDLINVAFENPRVKAHLGQGADFYEECPDRKTGRASVLELQKTCPGRNWQFLAVNVSYTEFSAHRLTIVSLMHPHDTEMDLSIASALYFAARGVADAGETSARVLLSGLGADELFGGYGRHAVAFRIGASEASSGVVDADEKASTAGYAALARELHLDITRLSRRNLGRDDRVLSHWGREVRYPFLDEQLVRWAIALPVWAKCDFGTADGESKGLEPAKRVLRLLANSLGLSGVAREKKRAIQFGARTAKMEIGRIKGTARVG